MLNFIKKNQAKNARRQPIKMRSVMLIMLKICWLFPFLLN